MAAPTAPAPVPTRDLLTSGTVRLTVVPDAHWRHVQLVGLGNTYHESYTYRIERVESANGAPTFFLHTLTGTRWVYTGVVHPLKGTVRLTARSAFPEHATRVRVAGRVLQALFAGRGDRIVAAGWTVTVEVEKEATGRF